MTRTLSLPALTLLALALAAGPAPAKTTTKTLKLKSGTTTLTLDPTAAGNLQAMGIAMSGITPATTAGPVLRFPVVSGTVKLKGARVLAGKIVHGGKLSMARQAVQVQLTDPTVNLTRPATLTGALQGLAIPVGTLNLTSARATLTRTTVKISRITVSLTPTAATSMNATFGVTGFKAGDKIGVATLSAKLKRA